MPQDPFRPFETTLPRDEALAVLQAATAGAEDGELFVERRKSEALVFDDGRLRSASYDASEGFGLRAVQGEVAGYAHSTEVSIPALKRAAETARLAVGGTMAAASHAAKRDDYGATINLGGGFSGADNDIYKPEAAHAFWAAVHSIELRGGR